MTSCTGLYADVVHTEDTVLSPGSIMKAIQPDRDNIQNNIRSIQALTNAGMSWGLYESATTYR